MKPARVVVYYLLFLILQASSAHADDSSLAASSRDFAQKFYDAYKGKGFELIAVSIDDDEKLLRDVCKERGFTFPVAWRYDDKTDDNFGDIIGTPTLYIVDKTGKVAWMKRGRVTYAQLQEIVEPLLK